MPLPLAGYNTAGLVNNEPIALTEWEVLPEVDDIGSPNTESGGFHVATPGAVKCEVTITGFYDGSINPFAIGDSGLVPGQFVALQIYINDNAAVGGLPFWEFPISPGNGQFGAMVKSYQNKGNVKERVMFTARLVGSGEFVYPAATVA